MTVFTRLPFVTCTQEPNLISSLYQIFLIIFTSIFALSSCISSAVQLFPFTSFSPSISCFHWFFDVTYHQKHMPFRNHNFNRFQSLPPLHWCMGFSLSIASHPLQIILQKADAEEAGWKCKERSYCTQNVFFISFAIPSNAI